MVQEKKDMKYKLFFMPGTSIRGWMLDRGLNPSIEQVDDIIGLFNNMWYK